MNLFNNCKKSGLMLTYALIASLPLSGFCNNARVGSECSQSINIADSKDIDIPANGVYVYDIDGRFITSEFWKSENNSKAVGIALITDRIKAIIALHNAGNGKKVVWGPNGFVNGVTCSNVNSNAIPGNAIIDYNGENNTLLLKNNLNPGENTALSIASSYIFPNGKNGYLPALGELKEVFDNLNVINELIVKVGGERIEKTWYWSSTLHRQDLRAWAYGGDASGSRSFAQFRNGDSQLARQYGAAYILVRPFGVITKTARTESLNEDHSKKRERSIQGEWDISESKKTASSNTAYEGTLSVREDKTFKMTEVTWEFGNVTKRKKITREGTYKVTGNNLVFSCEPSKTTVISRIYPTLYSSKMKLADIRRLDMEAKNEGVQEQQNIRTSGYETLLAFRFIDENPNQVIISRDSQTLLLTRSEKKPQSKNLIGRWMSSDKKYEFKADGTYTQYIYNVQYRMMWKEVYTVTISGTWFYDGINFVLVSDPSKSTVKIQIQSINSQANRTQVQSRQRQLNKIALESQAEHRAYDNPRTSIANISYSDRNSFICQDGNNNKFVFTRVK